jgi:GH18 family chitinase
MSIVANCCDWVNLMAYDMYGFGFNPANQVMFQAPLYNGKFQAGYTPNQQDATTRPSQTSNQGYSIDYAIWMWTQGAKYGGTTDSGLGIVPGKILLGLPAYGRSFLLNAQFS